MMHLAPFRSPLVLVVSLSWSLASCEKSADRPADGVKSSGNGVLAVEPSPLRVSATEKSGLSRLPAVLTLKNTGTDPLSIPHVEAKCGCMTHETFEPLVLQPGTTTELSLKVSVPRYGTRETSVVIDTDSASTPQVVVPVVLQGPELKTPYVQSVPSQLRITAHRAGEPLSDQIVIRSVESPGPQWITGLIAERETLEAEVLELPAEKRLTDQAIRRSYLFKIRSHAPESPEHIKTDVLQMAGSHFKCTVRGRIGLVPA